MAAPRNLTPLMQKIRDALIGRKYKNHLRFEGMIIAARTQPPPNLPDGVSHKLADNYYCTRDGRRELTPPEAVYTGGQQLLAAGEEGATPGVKKAVTPGPAFNWDLETPHSR
ncbi:hypothetical protein BaRGS_00015833 [Batillaria attramentaria]|uniref:NADH dehydrogenase [ubiquinone] 1 alpha subcomplex subunit 7 n=1 Tax=Batillaria attramentaria TaxID=370345 RepID=A0ABD0L0J6_9CAEN